MLFTSERSVRFTHGFGAFAHAAQYDRHAERLTRRLRARIVADVTAADLGDGARVLDAGTGPGRLPVEIAAALPHLRLDGVDLSPQMIEHARHRPGADTVTFTAADVSDLPFPDATFDLIVSSISQHHWAVPEQGVRELRRVLRPGGRLWIYDVRWALGRATAAARTVFDPNQVHCEPRRLIKRLSAVVPIGQQA
jgi:ubiquinone/menaquinone biosynthesis C-methylase UbiE